MSFTEAVITVLGTVGLLSLPISGISLWIAIRAWLEVLSFRKSTHKVQYVDPFHDDNINKEVAESEAKFADHRTLDNATMRLDDASMI